MMRRVLLLILILAGGCATHRGVRPLRPHELATAPYQETVTSAQTGTLMYEGDCLLFREDDGKRVLLPVWPIGTVFNGTSVIFHQPGKADQRVVLGEEFQMSGQPIAWSALRGPSYTPFHQQCIVQPFFVSRARPAN